MREDARRGRIYLPQDELQAAGIEEEQLLRCEDSPELRHFLHQQLERARGYYRRAEELLPETDRLSQRSGLIMADIYRALLDEMERDDMRILERRIRLTPLRKFWIAWRTARREKLRARHGLETARPG